MLDRIIVIRSQDITEFFYVPPPSSVRSFIMRVVSEIKATQEYNKEIENVKKMLSAEYKKVNAGQCKDITPSQAQEIINKFTSTHPLDNRSIRDVITSAGAVELEKSIPRENFIEQTLSV